MELIISFLSFTEIGLILKGSKKVVHQRCSTFVEDRKTQKLQSVCLNKFFCSRVKCGDTKTSLFQNFKGLIYAWSI